MNLGLKFQQQRNSKDTESELSHLRLVSSIILLQISMYLKIVDSDRKLHSAASLICLQAININIEINK